MVWEIIYFEAHQYIPRAFLWAGTQRLPTTIIDCFRRNFPPLKQRSFPELSFIKMYFIHVGIVISCQKTSRLHFRYKKSILSFSTHQCRTWVDKPSSSTRDLHSVSATLNTSGSIKHQNGSNWKNWKKRASTIVSIRLHAMLQTPPKSSYGHQLL